MTDRALIRSMWTVFEPIHSVTYFGPESRAAFEGVGLRGFWRGYFAGRAAPLGRVGPAPVVATFFGFAPPMVARALPGVWELADPARALTARLDGAVAGLRRLNAGAAATDPAISQHPVGSQHPAGSQPPILTADAIEEAADLAVTAVTGLDHAGRALGAANAAQPVPDDALARIWWAATIVREHRGDGHIAALMAAELSARETLCWRAAVDIPREILQPARGWSDDEWSAGTDWLIARGWLSADGQPTEAGRTGFSGIEETTDRLAAPPWRHLGEVGTRRLRDLLTPLARACYAELPAQTPIAMSAP